jgi:hypothetical protein
MIHKEFCGRKVKYATYNAAEKGMKNLIRAKKEEFLHVYRCPDCQKFHVGHMRESERNLKQRKKHV